MKSFFSKYKHALILLYGLVYMAGFCYLENHVTTDYHVIHMSIDDSIPFIEYFIIPYLMWFGFIAVTVLYFLFTNKKEFFQLIAFLFIGMTLFLIVSYFYPNGHMLRPVTFPRDNIFTSAVKLLYETDTPTNILPSIHVYNSIGAYVAISRNQNLRKNKWIHIGSFVLTASIIASTVFLKQHSMFDVLSAFVMAAGVYFIVYRHKVPITVKQKTKRKQITIKSQ